MIYVAFRGDAAAPVWPGLVHCTTGGAESKARSMLGSGWRTHYRIAYDADYKHWQKEVAKSWLRKRWDKFVVCCRHRWALLKEVQLQQLWGGRPKRVMFGYMVTEEYWRRTHGWD